MASGDIKGFYRQKKKGAGVTKPSASASAYAAAKKRSSGKSPSAAATLSSSSSAQSPTLVVHGSFDLDDEFGPEEQLLRQFDLDMRYGPCIGLTRLERWDRASSMGLNPPPEIADLLRSASGGSKPAALECLWDGRV